MSEPEEIERETEESYFEVQLDRGTVALAALALAAVLVLAFLLGAWWGRRGVIDTTWPAPASAERQANDRGADDRVAADDGVTDEQPGDEVLVVDGRPPFGAEPVSARGAAPLTPVPPDPDPETTTPGPPPTRTAPSQPEERETRAARSSQRGWVVQVTAVRDRSDADALRRKLAGNDWPVRVVSSGGLHKVQVGPYGARADAERAEARLKSEERLATWLHRE